MGDHAYTMNEFPVEPVESLYFVSEKQMTGKIGKIFGHKDSPLLLTVHGQGQAPMQINGNLTMWSTKWRHHYFSIWELFMARKFLPWSNGKGGLHYAGDWVLGVGHNDAMNAGIHAACAAGLQREPTLPPREAELYRKLITTCIASAGTEVGV